MLAQLSWPARCCCTTTSSLAETLEVMEAALPLPARAPTIKWHTRVELRVTGQICLPRPYTSDPVYCVYQLLLPLVEHQLLRRDRQLYEADRYGEVATERGYVISQGATQQNPGGRDMVAAMVVQARAARSATAGAATYADFTQ